MYPLALIFVVLFVVESITMLTISQLSISPGYFWLEAFIDASCVAIAALALIRSLVQRGLIKPKPPLTPEALTFQSALMVFGIQSMLMLLFPLFGLDTDSLSLHLIDAFIFALLATLAIRYFLLAPRHQRFISATFQSRSQIAFNLFVAYLFGLGLMLLFLMNIYQQQHNSHIQQLIEREKLQLELLKETMQDQVSQTFLDVKILAKQHNLSNVLKGERDSFPILAQDYLNIATVKPEYEQIRYLDNRGYEQIRVDQQYNGPAIVTKDKLQNKANRYYFKDSVSLHQGEIFISPMDLNIEYGKIELPYKPIVRTATPVFDQFGTNKGIVIINLNASSLLANLKQAAPAVSGELMLLNQDGYWLHGHELEAAWAFMFPQYLDRKIQNIYPGVWQQIRDNESGALTTEHGYFIFNTIDTGTRLLPVHEEHANWPVWKLIVLVTQEDFDTELTEISRLLLIFFIIVSLVTGAGTFMYYRVQINNISAQKKIHHLAHHDTLTGLCNRRLFIEMLELELAHAKRDKAGLAVMYLDLDHFKPINDEFGHHAGDYLLKEIARRMRSVLRESDTLARLGGDEFAAILPAPGLQSQLELVAQRILTALEKPVIFENHELKVGISIGIAVHYKGQPLESLLHEADQAMYQSKQAGRNCYSFADYEEK